MGELKMVCVLVAGKFTSAQNPRTVSFDLCILHMSQYILITSAHMFRLEHETLCLHGRYNSFMSFQAWRSSGGISAYGGVIYFPIKTGTEELISRFKYIQLINKGYGGEAPPAIPHHPKQDVKRKVSFVRSLGGKGGPRRRTL